MRFSVLVVFLLLKFGHQAEFPAAAAFGKIQHHILWWERRNTENQTPTHQGPSNSSGAQRGGRGPRRRRFVPGLLILVFFLDFSLVFIVRF